MKLNEIFRRLVLAELNNGRVHRAGRPRVLTDEQALDCAFKILRTGMQWREIEAPVSYATVFRRIQSWEKRNVFQTAYYAALKTYKKLFPTMFYCVDSSYVKNQYGHIGTGRNHTDRGRKATKLSLIVDQASIVHGARCDPGNRPDVVLLESSLRTIVDLEKVALYADRGYDSRRNRHVCKCYGLKDRIFRRKTKTTRRTNAKRIVVEHAFAWLDQYRRLIRLYDQTPAKYLNWTFLALGNRIGKKIEEKIFFDKRSRCPLIRMVLESQGVVSTKRL